MRSLSNSARVSLTLLSMLILGTVAGVGVDRAILIPARAEAVGGSAPGGHETVLAALQAELSLSDDQLARVGEVFASHQSDIEEAWKQVHETLDVAIAEATIEVEAVLDSAQIERLHVWLARQHGSVPQHAPGRAH
jgi:hypothetical protein